MAINNVSKDQQLCQAQDEQWEQECYRIGCALAREEAQSRHEWIEERLYSQRPQGWSVEGFRERTIVTVFGDIRVRRRLYRDEDGVSHFLLDEYLGWERKQLATPSVMESVLELSTQVPLRRAGETISKLTAGVLSVMTVHRLVQKAGHIALVEEEQSWEACFERGEDVGSGNRVVDVLYTEADGVWVHLQRETAKHHELKSAIVYENWDRIGPDRYSLVEKQVYCHSNPAIPFWEGASLEWAKEYDLSKIDLVVVGGDGANWIAEGTGLFRKALFQLDGFHLARACGRGFGKNLGRALYESIRWGETSRALSLIEQAEPVDNPSMDKFRCYVKANIVSGIDWRIQSEYVPEGARGLGTMESNGDKLVANRMKKRGMSWTIKGAHQMIKLIQLSANGELESVCKRSPDSRPRLTPSRSEPKPAKVSAARKPGYDHWLEAGVPALNGPHSSRPWTQSLRNLVYGPHRLN